MSQMQRGVVKWFNNAKGFGFIEHESGKDVFVHYSVIGTDGFKTLKDGEEVDYELGQGDKGLHAVKVLRVNEESSSEGSVADKIEVELTTQETAGSTENIIPEAQRTQEAEVSNS